MQTAALQFDLPPELIAQQPCEPRDASRLLVLDRASATLTHAQFRDIGRWLRAGDLLVRNDTRVIPARFTCQRASGGHVGGLYLGSDGDHWQVLLKPSKRLEVGESLQLCGCSHRLTLVSRGQRGQWEARVEPAREALTLLSEIGSPPLPPYIRREQAQESDKQRYQTVYASEPGAVAAPTAGLHFTSGLLAQLQQQGVCICDLTLHVGQGTFAPVTVEDLREHPMHREWFECGSTCCGSLRDAREKCGRIVAVGTTTARVLESLPDLRNPASGWTDILIYPPYKFRHVDALITNFHLPGSTLLAMIMALAGEDLIRHAYQEAIKEKYRFYSYGDAMLIV